MAAEVELKLALPASAQRAFLRHPLLKQAVSRKTERLINIYYDTPGEDLRRHAMALRLRRQGKRWLQTVKCAGSTAAGLSSRPEWEVPYGGHFDFSGIDAAPVRKRLEHDRVRGSIAPVFETNFLRTTWHFEPRRGVLLELAFDRGWIAAAGRREAISELEIEIKRGEASDVFALARHIAERIGLAPATLSKAERGYRLFHGTASEPAKATEITLAAEMPPREGFRRIALSCLEHLQQNHEGGIHSDDIEYVHQLRVATRRLRAALRLFSPILPDSFAEALLPALRAQMALLGRARDMDVLFEEIAAPVMTSLADEPRLAALTGLVTERRFRERHAAKEALRSPAFGQLVLLAGDLLHRPPFHPSRASGIDGHAEATADGCAQPGRSAVPSEQDLAAFADRRIRKLRRQVLAMAKIASADDPVALHRLRIGIKRLRYALEFFAPLVRGKSLHNAVHRLTGIQDALGQINDLANAGSLLTECAGEDARLREAVTLIAGWHAARYTALLDGVPRALKQLRDMKRLRLSSTRNRE